MKTKTINLSEKLSKPAMLVAVLLLLVGAVQFSPLTRAATQSELRAKRDRLQQEIADATKKANDLHAHAETLREAIAGIDAQIAQVQRQIELLDSKIAILDGRLKEAETELERQKGLLKASLRALYKSGGATTVELLITSENFSEFMNEQEYLDRLKGSIQESAKRIVELKEQIQAEKTEQEKLRKEQADARSQLSNTRSQRQHLLNETEGEEARYRELAAKARQEFLAAERALAAWLGSAVSLGPVSRGDIIGSLGNTGLSSGPHVHLEARIGGSGTCADRINPMSYINNGTWRAPVDSWHGFTPYGIPSGGSACGIHKGADYAAPKGTPIKAVANGDVVARGCYKDFPIAREFGYAVIVRHPNNVYSLYAHMVPPSSHSYCNYNIPFGGY